MLKLKKRILFIGFVLAIPLIGGIASACSTARNVSPGNQGSTETVPSGSNNNQNKPETNNKQSESEGSNNQTKPETNNKQNESEGNNNQTNPEENNKQVDPEGDKQTKPDGNNNEVQPKENNKQSEAEIKKEKETVIGIFNKIPVTAITTKKNKNVLPSNVTDNIGNLNKANEQLKNKIPDVPNEFEYLISAEGNDDKGILNIKIGLRKKDSADFFDLQGNRSTTQVNKVVLVSGYQNNKEAALSFYKKITDNSRARTVNTNKNAMEIGEKFREIKHKSSSSISEQIKFINDQIKEAKQKLPSSLTVPKGFVLKISASPNVTKGKIVFKFSLLKNEKIYDKDGSSRELEAVFEKPGVSYMSGKDFDIVGYTTTESAGPTKTKPRR